MDVKVGASILAADFSRLGEEAQRAEEAGADRLHLDVMDGQFVENLSMGPAAVAAIRKSTKLFLDVHLMVYRPERFIEAFVKAGADAITIHHEATDCLNETLQAIRSFGVLGGVSFRPVTPASAIDLSIEEADQLLIMTVDPGFGGQPFMPEMLEKIRYARTLCQKLGLKNRKTNEIFDIAVDGGITVETGQLCYDVGANIFVAGTYLYQPDMAQRIQKFHLLSQRGGRIA